MLTLKSILYFLLSMITLSSCAQSKQTIKNSYAYLLVTHAGMIEVDDNGDKTSTINQYAYPFLIKLLFF
jgi:hypothetical protein